MRARLSPNSSLTWTENENQISPSIQLRQSPAPSLICGMFGQARMEVCHSTSDNPTARKLLPDHRYIIYIIYIYIYIYDGTGFTVE